MATNVMIRTIYSRLIATLLLTIACNICYAQQPELVIPVGHQGEVSQLDINKEKDLIITVANGIGTPDNSIKLWNLSSGNLVRSMQRVGKTVSFGSAIFSPDGNHIATSSPDSFVVWNTLTGEQEGAVVLDQGFGAMYFSKDSKHLYCSNGCNTMHVYDVTQRKKILTFTSTSTICNGNLADYFDNDKGIVLGFRQGEDSLRYLHPPRFIDLHTGAVLKSISDTMGTLAEAFMVNNGTQYFIIRYGSRGRILELHQYNNDSLLKSVEVPFSDCQLVMDKERNSIILLEEYAKQNASAYVFSLTATKPDKKLDLGVKWQGMNTTSFLAGEGRYFVYHYDNTRSVQVVDLETGLIYALSGNGTYSYCVPVNGQPKLALLADDSVLVIYNLKTRTAERSITTAQTKETQWLQSVKLDNNIALSMPNGFLLWDVSHNSPYRLVAGTIPINNCNSFTAVFLKDSRYIATVMSCGFSSRDTKYVIWDRLTGSALNNDLNNSKLDLYALFGQQAIDYFINNEGVWMVKAGDTLGPMPHLIQYAISRNVVSKNKDWCLITTNTGELLLYSLKQAGVAPITLSNSGSTYHTAFSAISDNGKYLYFTEENPRDIGHGQLICYDLQHAKRLSELPYINFPERAVEKDSSNSYFVFRPTFFGDSIFMFDMNTNKILLSHNARGNSLENKIASSFFSRGGERFAMITNIGDIEIYQLATGKLINKIRAGGELAAIGVFMPSCTQVATAGISGTPVIWDIATGKIARQFKEQSPKALSIDVSSDGKHLLTTTTDLKLQIWGLEKNKRLCSSFSYDNQNFITLTNEGYYMGTKDAANKLLVRYGLKSFRIGQFDLIFNRPDKVVSALGNTDTTYINSLQEAYRKRLKLRGFVTEPKASLSDMPQVAVAYDNIETVTGKAQLNMKVHFSDTISGVNSYNLYINSNPVYGKAGRKVNAKANKQLDAIITATLAEGKNVVAITCINNNGVESLKETFTITYTPSQPTEVKVWFVGIGVSDYQDTALNLRYAAKDITDLAAIFKEHYPDANVITLVGPQVTAATIKLLKKQLMQTNTNDKVIIAMSGHGLLSDSLDFYYATWDMDFKHPETKGLAYDNIELLLDSIPALNKILMIDACHSGEVDRQATKVRTNADPKKSTTNGQVAAKGIGEITVDNSVGLENSYELMGEMFADLSSGNGSAVISAAGGLQYALESNEWNNGIFTYCVKKGLLENAADTNYDGKISVSELRNYVSKMVEKMTDGAQKPTSRKTNLDNDWIIW